MWSKIKKKFLPPGLGDEDEIRTANLLTAIILTLLFIMIVRIILTMALVPQYLPAILQTNFLLLIILAVVFVIMRRGRVNAACIMFTFCQWLSIAWLTYRYGGLNLSVYGFFIFVILSAGLLLGGKWALSYAVASVSYGLLLLLLEEKGLISSFPESSYNAFNTITPSFITTAVIVYLYCREIKEAINRALDKTAQLELINQQLTNEITTRVRTEKQLLQAQKMEAIGTLAGGIAHDFNNILSAILGYTELMKMKIPMETRESDYLDKIFKASNRAKDLVRQILTFSRQTEHTLQPVSIKRAAKEAMTLLRASLPSTIDIKQNIETDSTVIGDATQIHQIIMNLCTNAAHAMREEGGILEISISDVELDREFVSRYQKLKTGGYVRLTVSDTGEGMPSEVLKRIFEPFYSTKMQGEGTGLGLAVVHGIVEGIGGMISAYSKLGEGSSFKVFLPVAKGSSDHQKELKESLPKGTERILFIDDEPSLVEIGEQVLKKLGYQVVAMTSPTEALNLFRSEKGEFDLVITDMTMPVLTGDKLAKELSLIRKNIPIIICTGFSYGLLKEDARKMGFKGFLMKPILQSEIAKLIRTVLDEFQSIES